MSKAAHRLALILPVLVIAFQAYAAEEPAAVGDDVAAGLVIDAGRLGVMMDQAEAAAEAAHENDLDEELETPEGQTAYAARALRDSILRFNGLQLQVCRGNNEVPAGLCGAPYLPGWLNEPVTQRPAPAVLTQRLEDAMQHISPLWSALCDKAKAAGQDEHFCDLE